LQKKQNPATILTGPQVHAFRLERHHLTARSRKKDLARKAWGPEKLVLRVV